MMSGAIVATAFWIAVIHMRVKPFASGITVLLVSHGAKWHATHFATLLIAQNRVIFLSAHFGALKSDQLVVFWVVNYHSVNRVNVQYVFT